MTADVRAAHSKRRILGISGVGLIVLLLIAMYVFSAVRYSEAGKSQVQTGLGQVSDGVNFRFDLVAVDPSKSQITFRTFIIPEGSYFNESDQTFAKSVRVTVRRQTGGEVARDILAGTPVGSATDFNVLVTGEAVDYPFDRYSYGLTESGTTGDGDILQPAKLLSVTSLDQNDMPTAQQVPIGVFEVVGLQGWKATWKFSESTTGTAGNSLFLDLEIKRGGGVLAFVIVVLGLMVVTAVLAGLVASSVFRQRRPIEATMAGWFAALLFALVPLRTNMPGAPPIGAWMDVLVFYWVEMALLTAMAVFIGSWLRYRQPPTD